MSVRVSEELFPRLWHVDVLNSLGVSLGLYGDSRTQGGGNLNMIARDDGKTTEDKERT
jgi:hypothetical protein